MMRAEYLFVYGTLMTASGHPMARWLGERAQSIGEGSYAGRLYRVAHYPGLVPSTDPADRVVGELFHLREQDTLLAKLDDYEGCGPNAAKPTLYVRVLGEILRPDRTSVTAWVYHYNRPVSGLQPITSGRFL